MTQHAIEKVPIDRSDYEGLQLDLRASDQKEKYLDSTVYAESPRSPDGYQPAWSEKKGFYAQPQGTDGSETWKPPMLGLHPPMLGLHPAFARREEDVRYSGNTVDSSLAPEPRRICGLRRRTFWIVLGIGLSVVIIGAIIGGVFAGRSTKSIPGPAPAPVSTPPPATSSNSTSSPIAVAPPSPSSSSPGSSSPEPSQSDVMVNSPLAIVAYTANATSGSSSAGQQAYRLYFQSAHGNIKESVYDGPLSSWEDAHPIFTDAINNTGIAVITYMNNSVQQSSIFYVGSNGLVQEKRLYPGTTVWQPGTINKSNLKAFGNLTAPDNANNDQDPSNGWGSYRMAAVFSQSFKNGPGARLFYHTQSDTGASLVQEMLWDMGTDTWSQGYQFSDPWPKSDLTATTDPTTQTLRLFYSSGNLTLQESWLNMTDPSAVYKSGVTIPSLLAHNDASLAAVPTNANVLLYYYASQDIASIRELAFSGIPGSSHHPETFTAAANAPIVAQPALVTNTSQVSLYQPIGAVVSSLGSGTNRTIQVFWAEGVTGVTGATSGYSALKTLQRNGSHSWPPSSYGTGSGQVEIPLGNSNADPSS
ncbi:hypothetical protein MMC30_006749 [Trapelia coarctata]|nr:hypothetical protein [Trapelia coarctata]